MGQVVRDWFADRYCDYLLGPLSFTAFWASQGSFLCWLLGHDHAFLDRGNCGRCGMGWGYYKANNRFLNRQGLLLSWRWQLLAGKAAEIRIWIAENL
jgi:hypothetical protein